MNNQSPFEIAKSNYESICPVVSKNFAPEDDQRPAYKRGDHGLTMRKVSPHCYALMNFYNWVEIPDTHLWFFPRGTRQLMAEKNRIQDYIDRKDRNQQDHHRLRLRETDIKLQAHKKPPRKLVELASMITWRKHRDGSETVTLRIPELRGYYHTVTQCLLHHLPDGIRVRDTTYHGENLLRYVGVDGSVRYVKLYPYKTRARGEAISFRKVRETTDTNRWELLTKLPDLCYAQVDSEAKRSHKKDVEALWNWVSTTGFVLRGSKLPHERDVYGYYRSAATSVVSEYLCTTLPLETELKRILKQHYRGDDGPSRLVGNIPSYYQRSVYSISSVTKLFLDLGFLLPYLRFTTTCSKYPNRMMFGNAWHRSVHNPDCVKATEMRFAMSRLLLTRLIAPALRNELPDAADAAVSITLPLARYVFDMEGEESMVRARARFNAVINNAFGFYKLVTVQQ